MTDLVWPGYRDAALRVVAALVGTLPVAVLGSVCLAKLLPFDEATRVALGFTLAIPLWVALMSFAFLARSGWRAWAWCLVATLLLGLVTHGIPQ